MRASVSNKFLVDSNGHSWPCPISRAHSRLGPFLFQFRQPEVEDLEPPVVALHEIVGFQIPMFDRDEDPRWLRFAA